MARHIREEHFQAIHYSIYWRFSAEERQDLNQWREAKYAAFRFRGEETLERFKKEDVLWILNVHVGRLYLMGRIKVTFTTRNEQLAQELVDTDKEWYEGNYFAIADRRDVELLRQIDITERVFELHFEGEKNTLKFPLDAQQLRHVRQLTTESAELLSGIWYSHQDTQVNIQDYVDDFLELTEDDRAYSEGRLVMRTLTERQRNRQLVKAAKERARRKHGRLLCEVCGFDFLAVYGADYIEAHHAEQMASLSAEKETTLDELHMLCANCHRMVHRRTPPYSVTELKDILLKHKERA
jgi:hypothetical protein